MSRKLSNTINIVFIYLEVKHVWELKEVISYT